MNPERSNLAGDSVPPTRQRWLHGAVVWLREIVWAYRVKKCWRQAVGDYGQFLSNIGFCRAYGTLPHDILKRCGLDEPDNSLDKPTAPLVWSKNRPTKPGWYWCQNAGDTPGELWEAVVRIDVAAAGGERICCWMQSPGIGAVMREADWSKDCLWAGPLTPPKRANDQAE